MKKFKLDRSLLPLAKDYYCGEFSGLKTNQEWIKVVCPFHDDHTPSLSINLKEGHFKCHACHIKGGDIISFHQKRYHLSFVEACQDLGVIHE